MCYAPLSMCAGSGPALSWDGLCLNRSRPISVPYIDSKSPLVDSCNPSHCSKRYKMIHSNSIFDFQVGGYCNLMKPCPPDHLCMDSCHCPGFECIKCNSISSCISPISTCLIFICILISYFSCLGHSLKVRTPCNHLQPSKSTLNRLFVTTNMNKS